LPLRLYLAGSLVKAPGLELLKALSGCIAPTLAMSLAALQISYLLTGSPTWLRLSACISIGAVTYLGVAFLTSRQAILDAVESVRPKVLGV
jgi:threonine/homoserine/homoserine lactone efflux protein